MSKIEKIMLSLVIVIITIVSALSAYEMYTLQQATNQLHKQINNHTHKNTEKYQSPRPTSYSYLVTYQYPYKTGNATVTRTLTYPNNLHNKSSLTQMFADLKDKEGRDVNILFIYDLDD